MKSKLAKKIRGAERKIILSSMERKAGAFKDKTKYNRAKEKKRIIKDEQ